MRIAPRLDPAPRVGPVRERSALLINPFYAKDPHASFGKHVLTPTLALTTVAAATPDNWTVSYWDENLLQGPPPCDPLPEAVGITLHLTFAKRAFELARWYRERGTKVILGGLHVISCPDECAQPKEGCCTKTGIFTTPRMLYSSPNVCPSSSLRTATSGVTAAYSRTRRFGNDDRRTGEVCSLTWRCRIFTSDQIGSGRC